MAAVVIGGTARWDSHTGPEACTPAEADIALALTRLAVVIVRAFRRDGVAGVGDIAPVVSLDEGRASSAAVRGTTARRGLDAGLGDHAPVLALRADAVASHAVVGVELGTVLRDVVAALVGLTPGRSRCEGQACAAVVTGVTAGRDSHALSSRRAPGGSQFANAVAAAVVVVRALLRDDRALAAVDAPGGARPESHAVATSIAGFTAGWHIDAGALGRAK